uniref:FtsX-like permease family protein n=1 Tax=Candidatus Kentrum sp. MB TaxID=2138164 RepID=A0A451BCL8_9GAMM|nr:MAG: FtsX-like permease family protein [Candidatus Kentron sp. MB]VFK76023.1 MAG: FtsX-like permease family protein [Candidatus Kentron sp. MB]
MAPAMFEPLLSTMTNNTPSFSRSYAFWLAIRELRHILPGTGPNHPPADIPADFRWLVLLLSMSLILALLLSGTYRGIARGVLDITLGYAPDAGVPIWVQAKGFEHPIDREAVVALKRAGYAVFPYLEDMTGRLGLPGAGHHLRDGSPVWRKGGVESVPTIRAVRQSDPLWRQGADAERGTKFPNLSVVLDRVRFEQHFDCDAYVRTSPVLLKRPATGKDPLWCLADNRIFLMVRIENQWEQLAFTIRWAPRIRTFKPVDILAPLAFANTVWLAGHLSANPEGAKPVFFPEGNGSATERIRAITMVRGYEARTEPIQEERAWNAFRDCLERFGSGFENKDTGDFSARFISPQSRTMVGYCAGRATLPIMAKNARLPREGLHLKITETVRSVDWLSVKEPDVISVDCARAKAAFKRLVECDDRNGNVDLDLTRIGSGYSAAMVYERSRDRITKAIEEIPTIRVNSEERFEIHSAYLDSRRRFGFLTDIIHFLVVPLGFFFLTFFVLVSLAQVGILLSRRRHAFGILLAQGLSRGDIFMIPIIQVVFCFVGAFAAAEMVVLALSIILNEWFAEMVQAKGYADTLITGAVDLLPIPWWQHLAIFVGGLVLIVLLVIFRVRSLPLGKRFEPAVMIAS